ncbi:Casparian strip membrane protein 1 [Capsicum chinense]|nr:Casparian strip membrane protein 1 [Capsicum chinense]
MEKSESTKVDVEETTKERKGKAPLLGTTAPVAATAAAASATHAKRSAKRGIAIFDLILRIAAFAGITEFQNPTVHLISSTSPSPSVYVTRNFMDGMISYNPDSWSLTFMVKNPNNIYILYYDDLEAKISYNDIVYWQANVSANFHQEEKSEAFIDATFGALNDTNIDYIVDYVVHDVHAGHPTSFLVSLDGKVQISHRIAHNRLNCGKLQVSCEGLGVEFLPTVNIGTLAVTSNACDQKFADDDYHGAEI